MDKTQNSALEALVKAAGGRSGPRPVEAWDPPYCGDIGMAIGADATWTYRGSPILRTGLVKLFATILRKDADGRTYLVTPAEKVDVTIADAPFLAVDMAVAGEGREQTITFRTNVDDLVAIDRDHPVRFEVQAPSGGLKPYVLVRGRLEALVTRALHADLVALANEENGTLGLWSGGVWWPLDAK